VTSPIARLAALAALLAAALEPDLARADDEPDRTVAVLEFRGGSDAIPDVGRRAAALLRDKTSLNVLDVDDARARAGAAIDRRVAECAGEGACIAELGSALATDEVLLLGVSEFGDVILTLQRIDVASHDVVSRVAEALPPGKDPDHRELLDYVRRVMPRTDFLRFGTVRIETNVDGAAVMIGGVARGHTPLEPLRVRAPASYDITVHKRGYSTFKVTVDVPPDALLKVSPVLVAERRVWYEHWWVVALAGGVAAAAVTVAIAATRGEPDELPVVIPPFEPGAEQGFVGIRF
jgi:hypothetical protein